MKRLYVIVKRTGTGCESYANGSAHAEAGAYTNDLRRAAIYTTHKDAMSDCLDGDAVMPLMSQFHYAPPECR